MYVGFATNIQQRWATHKSDLRKGIHENGHLQNAWNEYGEENFIHEMLVECEVRDMASEEHYWCNLLRVHEDQYGYNIRPTHPYGRTSHSEESKKKMSEIQKIVCNTPERLEYGRKRMTGTNYGKGRIVTEENRRRLREFHTGRKASPEAIEKNRLWHTGRKQSVETVEKRMLKVKGVKRRKNTKLSEYKTGRAQPKHYKAVICIDVKTGEETEYESVKSACEHLGIHKSCPFAALKDNKKKRNGYYWRYKITI